MMSIFSILISNSLILNGSIQHMYTGQNTLYIEIGPINANHFQIYLNCLIMDQDMITEVTQ